MREEPDTEFLGLRGLLVQARRAGRDAEALALARRAFELRPKTPWVLQELFALEAQAEDFAAAQKVLDQAGKQGLVEQQELRRRRGVVHLAAAQAADARGESSRAIEEARKALDQVPGLTPAAALAARLHIAAGEIRKARKLLEQAWSVEPHRDLAAVYLTLDPKASESERLKALKRFAAGQEEHPEARIAVARAALAIGDREEARSRLEPMLRDQADADVCRLMAEIAERAGDTATAGKWLHRAAAAPGSAGWQCGSCGHLDDDWSLHCPTCGAFDTMAWHRPAVAPALAVLSEEEETAEAQPPAEGEHPGEHEKLHLGDIAPTASRP
jgi:HemY protein